MLQMRWINWWGVTMTGQFQRGPLLGGGGLIDPPLRVVKFRVETFFFYDPLAE